MSDDEVVIQEHGPDERPARRCATCGHQVLANRYAKAEGTVWGKAAQHTTAYCMPCPHNKAPGIQMLRGLMRIQLVDNWTEEVPSDE
jgi:hypothetical protein